MWYFLIRFIFNIFIFFVRLFEKLLDLDKKWLIFTISLSSCFFTEWAYGLFGEYRIDYFFCLIAAWFPLWIFLVTEFILSKPLKMYIYFIYLISITLIYLITLLFNINYMPALFYFFWLFFYIVSLSYCSFKLSLIILLIQHFKLIQRFIQKTNNFVIFFVKSIYILFLLCILISYFLIYIYLYIIYYSLYTLYFFFKYNYSEYKNKQQYLTKK